MRILHLLYESKGDSFGIGGVGARAYEIYRRLKERHEITLLCRRYPGARDREIEGLRHIFVGAESGSFTRTLLAYAFSAGEYVRKNGHRFDVIVEEFSPALPTFLNLYRKRPVVLQIQGHTGKHYFEKYNPFYASVLYMLEKTMPRYYGTFVFVSEASRERFRLGGNKNVRIISNGIREELLRLEPGESDYILYLGRIDIHHKGLDILLEAYRNLGSSFPGIRLVVAGEGRDREAFAALLEALPEERKKKVTMAGWVEGERKLSLLKDAICVVMPSRYETQGIVALEAMACAKAVVVSDIPELRYVTESGGISFPSGDPASLSGALEALLSTGDSRLIGRRGREWVRKFTWERAALEFEDFLLEAVGRESGQVGKRRR